MTTVAAIIRDFLFAVGALFCVLAAVGMIRMPDLYLRMHSSTKAGTLGVGCVLAGVAVEFGSAVAFIEAGLVIGFLFLTAPIASHLIARAAYFERVPLWRSTRSEALDQTFTSGEAGSPTDREPPSTARS